MILRIFFIVILLSFTGCSMFGWEGRFVNMDFYKEKKEGHLQPNPEKESERLEAMSRIKLVMQNGETKAVVLPSCSTFLIGGLFTPITPPLPFFLLRSWWISDDSPCNYLGVRSDPLTKVTLRYKDTLYEPVKFNSEKRIYTFPIRAKSINSGSIIIEKDGEKIEVPFEYKYMKFWY